MLELKSVTRSAGREMAFSQVDLQFSADNPTTFLGLSPDARKAALRVIGGADRPDAGTIVRDGVHQQRRKGSAYFTWIGRDAIAPSGRTAGKALREAASGKPDDADLGRLLARVGLAGKLAARTKDLDPGERVRLAIGCALAARREMILLDAPFQEVQPEARLALLADLSHMLAGAGQVIVLAASAADEALALGGRTVILARGRVVQAGPTAEVFAHPRNLQAALATAHPFLNTLTATLTGDACRLADGSTFHAPEALKLPPAGRCTLAFRPDDLGFERQNDHAIRFAARADGEETVSGRRYVRTKFADAVWHAPHPGREISPGIVLNVFVDVDRVLAFDEAGLAVNPSLT
jgi:ABC-type sulfate/molybdate transport systems ATPase subunit